jgi:hypothetical protein
MAGYIILLGTPRELNIPYFAMGSSHAKENCITRLGLDNKLSKFMGRRCIAWINARKNQEKITFVETRNYVPPKTAFYADWLLLESEAAFRDFLQTFPHYCRDTRLGKINGEREALSVELERRVKRRDFDLSRVGDDQQRANLARRYVEITDKLRQLHEGFRLLETAKAVSEKWHGSF